MTQKQLVILFLTAVCLPVNAQTNKKSTVDAESITIQRDSTATVLDWFKFIEQKDIVLSYDSSNIDLDEKVEIKRKTFTVARLLETILHRYDFEADYSFGGKVLLQIKGLKKMVLSGFVYDENTKEPLEGCTIFFETQDHKKYSAVTDSLGRFTKKLPSSHVTLKVTYIGYTPHTSTLHQDKAKSIRISMAETALPLDEVNVVNIPMSDIVNYKGASSMLSVNGNDPFAQLYTLPGILNSSVGGGMHVNGGQSDENLILIDGVSIYHSHHNNTLLSQFNGEAVERVSFFDSFIPAQYEGRLSSVTDVRIKKGDSLNHCQTMELDLPSASLTLDGPIIKNKLTYMVSGRHSWIDFMRDLFSSHPNAGRTFSDMTGKISYRVNPNISIDGLIYRSSDKYNDSINIHQNYKILEWENTLYSVSSLVRLPKGVKNTSTVSYSKYINRIYGPVINIHTQDYISEGMSKYTVKSSFTKVLNDYIDLSWGFNVSHEKFNLLASQETVQNNSQHVTQISSFVNSQIRITDKWFGSVALNLVSYVPKDNESFFSIQPRFTFRYIADRNNIFSVDFSRMEQFYHNVCVGEIPIPTDLRMPSIEGFKPSSAVHCEIGWKHFDRNGRTSVSCFYKRRFDILGIRNNFSTNEEGWHRFIMKGNAESYGLKVHSVHQWNRWKLDCSYTYSRSLEWFKEFEQNKKNPTLHDVPHIFYCAASYMTGRHSALSVGGYAKSGILENVFNYENNNLGEFITGRDRKKLNYRLDLNFANSVTLKNKRLIFSYKVGLYNIVGNPKENEVLDLYSVQTKKHCLPYFSITAKFN